MFLGRIKSRNKSYIYSHLIFEKSVNKIYQRKYCLFNKVLGQLDINKKKKKKKNCDPDLACYMQINLRWKINPNVEPKII